MNHSLHRRALAAAFVLACGMAQAHPGHAPGLLDGAVHPWQGLDHLLAMVGVGWWAAQLGGRARLILPCAFVGLMALGLGAALAGHVLPLREEGAAWSVLALGLLIACAGRASTAAAAVCVGVFGLAHGAAHGAGLAPQPDSFAFAAAVLVSTALLHTAGLLAAGALASRARWLRAGGVLLAAGGVWLVAA